MEHDTTALKPALNLKAIYEEHFDFVWRVLARHGVPEADVMDAAQDVFLIAHRKLPAFEGRSKVSTWLCGIAVRVAADRRRLAYVRRAAPDDALASTVDATADVSAAVEQRQGLRMLGALIEGLPPERRDVFQMAELEGMTCDTIARVLGIPVGTVNSRLRLARAMFEKAASRLMVLKPMRMY